MMKPVPFSLAGNPVMPVMALTGLILFLATVVTIFILGDTWADDHVFNFLSPHIAPDRTRFMVMISFFGSHLFLIPANLLLLLYFLVKKNKWQAIRVAAISLSSLGLMSLLKTLFHRHRPAHPLVEGITNHSFPSGHAFMSVAFYGLLVWLALRNIKNKGQQRAILFFLLLLILLISFSRIYLRVHYTSDIIAGLSMGSAWLIFCLAMINTMKARNATD